MTDSDLETQEYRNMDFKSEELTGTKGAWLMVGKMQIELHDTLTNYEGMFYTSDLFGQLYMFKNSEDHWSVRRKWIILNKK